MSGPLLAFVDCETTGLDPNKHEVWEVGLAIYDQTARCVQSMHVWQLPLARLAAADPEALKIGGFHERRWSDHHLATWEQFSTEFTGLVLGLPMVGANPAFDAEFLARRLAGSEHERPWHYRVVDIEATVFGSLHGYSERDGAGMSYVPETVPWSSTELSEAVGVVRDPATMHTAMGDVLWYVDLWEKVTVG